MSNYDDPGVRGQYRVVPLITGKFNVESYDTHSDAGVSWLRVADRFDTQAAAEAWILERIGIDERLKREREEAEHALVDFQAKNPPYVYPS